MTEYLVLQKNNGDDGWAQVGPDRVKANSARSAISLALENRTASADGEFVAIPARSWQPVKVQVEQALKFS